MLKDNKYFVLVAIAVVVIIYFLLNFFIKYLELENMRNLATTANTLILVFVLGAVPLVILNRKNNNTSVVINTVTNIKTKNNIISLDFYILNRFIFAITLSVIPKEYFALVISLFAFFNLIVNEDQLIDKFYSAFLKIAYLLLPIAFITLIVGFYSLADKNPYKAVSYNYYWLTIIPLFYILLHFISSYKIVQLKIYNKILNNQYKNLKVLSFNIILLYTIVYSLVKLYLVYG